jgi:hypothetical protein
MQEEHFAPHPLPLILYDSHSPSLDFLSCRFCIHWLHLAPSLVFSFTDRLYHWYTPFLPGPGTTLANPPGSRHHCCCRPRSRSQSQNRPVPVRAPRAASRPHPSARVTAPVTSRKTGDRLLGLPVMFSLSGTGPPLPRATGLQPCFDTAGRTHVSSLGHRLTETSQRSWSDSHDGSPVWSATFGPKFGAEV